MSGGTDGAPGPAAARSPVKRVGLTRNALSGAGRLAIPALLALLVTPYALRVLGDDRFGLWALAGVVLTLARVLDLGLQRAMVRAVAHGEGLGDRADSVVTLATGRGAMAVLGVAYVFSVWLARDVLVEDVLRLPPELWPEGRLVLVGTAMVAAVEAVFTPYQAALEGIGRMDLSSVVDAAQRSISAVGVVLVLSLGWGLPGLVWKNLAIAIAAAVAYRAVLARLAPDLSRAPVALVRERLRQLLVFGRHVQTVNVSALLVDVVAKTALGRAEGVSVVALYELALRVVNQIGGALMAAAAAVFPAAAEAGADPDRGDEALLALYFGATKYLGWLVLTIYAMVVALAPQFVRAWLGEGYGAVADAMAALSLGYVLGVLAAPAHMVAQGAGRERASSMAALVTVAVALTGVWVLLPRFGLSGVVAAVGLGVASGGVAAWALFARSFGTGWRTVGCLGARGPAAALLGAAAARATVAFLPETLLGVAVAGLCGLAAVTAALVLTGALGPGERAAVRAMIGAVVHRGP